MGGGDRGRGLARKGDAVAVETPATAIEADVVGPASAGAVGDDDVGTPVAVEIGDAGVARGPLGVAERPRRAEVPRPIIQIDA